MTLARLAQLKFAALLFLLPGLGGLVVSAGVSTHYLDSLPKDPAPDELRMTPRNIHGVVVYQTQEEDQRLSLMEGISVVLFVTGFGLGVYYLKEWGQVQANAAGEDDLSEDLGGRG